jgi:hypothetical protein
MGDLSGECDRGMCQGNEQERVTLRVPVTTGRLSKLELHPTYYITLTKTSATAEVLLGSQKSLKKKR